MRAEFTTRSDIIYYTYIKKEWKDSKQIYILTLN